MNAVRGTGGQCLYPASQNSETIGSNSRVGCPNIVRVVRAMDPRCSRNPSTNCGGLSVFFTSGCRVDGLLIPRASFAGSLCPGLCSGRSFRAFGLGTLSNHKEMYRFPACSVWLITPV